ncbi:PHP domain-containing protein [Desulfospira joergensenii]|uniref:PHP domain-containing protein n=1 Tax=Desulfospira joergensenii TaxID=53329 RepID=UPI0003B518A0|nr:PHP domain-containing protein [Desulfospira joergensenii]
MKIYADLHNHTTASDGDFSPELLVKKAGALGLKALGITDHDTLKGLAPGLAAGEAQGITVVPGVEVSIRFKRPYFTGTLHLLCYFSGKRLGDENFVKTFESLLADGRGEGLVRARIDQINKIFGPQGTSPLLEREMEFEDISAFSSNASRRHFALSLNQRFGITDKQMVNSIIGNDSPAYLPSGIELDKIGGFIRAQDLTAVLAHPAAGSFPGEGHYKEVLPPVETVEKILPEFIEAGLRGIEVNYPGHAPEHRKILLDWAGTHNFFITGGSDCHDDTERPPGVEGISEQEFKIFMENIG